MIGRKSGSGRNRAICGYLLCKMEDFKIIFFSRDTVFKNKFMKNSLITTVGGAVRCSGKSKGGTKYVFTKFIKSSVDNNIIRWESVVYKFCSQHFVYYYYYYLIFLSYLIIQLRRSKKLKNFKQNVEKKMYSKISQH